MLTNNLNDSVNHIPLLSQEMERTLRRLAWKDENFRELLIADPKGVIQQVFPHCFLDGKIADDLTIKAIEEDPFTHHIVLPALPDQFPILEIAEEQQVDLIANMSRIRRLEGHPSYGAETCFPSSHDASGCGQQDQRKRVKSESKQKKIDWIKDQLSRHDGKTQEDSMSESKYSYGPETKKRRTDIKDQSS